MIVWGRPFGKSKSVSNPDDQYHDCWNTKNYQLRQCTRERDGLISFLEECDSSRIGKKGKTRFLRLYNCKPCFVGIHFVGLNQSRLGKHCSSQAI